MKIHDCTLVEDFKGLELFTSERPELQEDEYLKEDLVGLPVYQLKISYLVKRRFTFSSNSRITIVKDQNKRKS